MVLIEMKVHHHQHHIYQVEVEDRLQWHVNGKRELEVKWDAGSEWRADYAGDT